MSRADELFICMCRDIIDQGYSSEGQVIRAKWEDGTPAHTIKQFCIVNRYDLGQEFPALTLRPTAIKSATDELLWIWQKKSNNINELNSHIWDAWADENGSIATNSENANPTGISKIARIGNTIAEPAPVTENQYGASASQPPITAPDAIAIICINERLRFNLVSDFVSDIK